MSEANAKTLDVYNQEVEAYINGTIQKTGGHQKEWLDFVFQSVPKDARILELGSAFGRDATYLIEQGYHPDLTDGSDGFVDYLNSHGFEAKKLDIVNEQPLGPYDIILACAVFLHFTDNDFGQAVLHVKEALAKDGKFVFSVKQGNGEEWSEHKMGAARYFKYWQRDALEATLNKLGMHVIDFQILDGGRWLHVITAKAE